MRSRPQPRPSAAAVFMSDAGLLQRGFASRLDQTAAGVGDMPQLCGEHQGNTAVHALLAAQQPVQWKLGAAKLIRRMAEHL